jgi:hypothetical protein
MCGGAKPVAHFAVAEQGSARRCDYCGCVSVPGVAGGAVRRDPHGRVVVRAVAVGLSARVCPHCGHPPDDFVDEETVVEQGKVTKHR